MYLSNEQSDIKQYSSKQTIMIYCTNENTKKSKPVSIQHSYKQMPLIPQTKGCIPAGFGSTQRPLKGYEF